MRSFPSFNPSYFSRTISGLFSIGVVLANTYGLIPVATFLGVGLVKLPGLYDLPSLRPLRPLLIF